MRILLANDFGWDQVHTALSVKAPKKPTPSKKNGNLFNGHTCIGSMSKCSSFFHYSGRVEGSYSVWQPDGRLMTVGCETIELFPLYDPVFFFFVKFKCSIYQTLPHLQGQFHKNLPFFSPR